MNRPNKLQPFLRMLGKNGRKLASRTGTTLIPIVSSEPKRFDCEQYGILPMFMADAVDAAAPALIIPVPFVRRFVPNLNAGLV